MNSIITVVDATNFFPHVNSYADFYRNQIRLATYLLISKSQLIEPEVVKQIENNLQLLNPTAPIWNRPWQEFSNDDLLRFLNKGNMDDRTCLTVSPSIESHHFESFSLSTGKKFTREELLTFLKLCKEGVYGGIVRGKGVVFAERGSFAFNYVSGQYEIRLTEECSASISFIGRDLKTRQLQKVFQ